MGNHVFILMPVGEKGKSLLQPTFGVSDTEGHGAWLGSVLVPSWVKPGQQITAVCTKG